MVEEAEYAISNMNSALMYEGSRAFCQIVFYNSLMIEHFQPFTA